MKKELAKFPTVKDSSPVVPKDLGVKIGTDNQVFWNDLRIKCEAGILQAEREIVINNHVIALAKQKGLEESETFK